MPCSRVLPVLSLVLFLPGPLESQDRSPEPLLRPFEDPYVRGCGRIMVDVRSVERTPVTVVNEEGCGPLRLLLAGSPRVSDRVTPSGERIRDFGVAVPVAVMNTAESPVRSPIWMYARTGRLVAFADTGRFDHPSARSQYVRFQGERDTRRAEFGEIVDIGRERMWRLLPADGDISLPATVAPGRVTATRWIGLVFWRNEADSAHLALELRALRPAAPIPAALPVLVEGTEIAGRPIVPPSTRFPRPVVADLIVLRHQAGLSPAARQLVIDRVGGRVVGILPPSGQEPDHLVEVQTDPTGAPAFRAVLRLRANDLRDAVDRVGLIPTAPPARPDRRYDSERLQDTTVLAHPGFDPEQAAEVRRRVVFVGFRDPTRREVTEVLDMVGGRILPGLPELFGTAVEVVGTAADAERARRQAWWLPQVRYTLIVHDVRLSPLSR